MADIRVIFLNGTLEGKSFPIEGRTTIGRSESNTICVEDGQVSSHHCLIDYDEKGYLFLKDLDSTNGTEINGKAVQSVRLNNGDEVVIGETRIFVRMKEDEPAPVVAPAAEAAPPPG